MSAQNNSTIIYNPYIECRNCIALREHALLRIHAKQQYYTDVS